jgi:hypothetical protein
MPWPASCENAIALYPTLLFLSSFLVDPFLSRLLLFSRISPEDRRHRGAVRIKATHFTIRARDR